MIDISKYLEKIKTAIYGEEVRGSIHDAIENIDDGKADKQNEDGGFEGGDGAIADMGGAIGNGAVATDGGAVGHLTNGGVNGFAGGYEAKVLEDENGNDTGGAAVGHKARAIDGGAVGNHAEATDGFSGGYNAKSTVNAIQLGTGTNTKEKTLQVYDYTLMNADGTIPRDRMDPVLKMFDKKADKQTNYGGFIGGSDASVYNSGAAVGASASARNGGAIGYGAQSSDGFSGGYMAKSEVDAIQLGTGTNTMKRTLQVYDHRLMDADGTIPAERLKNSKGGFAGGAASFSGDDTSGVVIGHYATNGGAGGAAVGSEANVTGNGAAVGYHASAKGGGAIGASATADNGFAGGMNASAGYGCAAGRNAVTKNGVAVGNDAKTLDNQGRAIEAIQLGTGTNTKEKTLQVYDYTLMDADGKIPPERLLNITASGKCGDQVFWVLSDDGRLVIYGEGSMYDFNVDGAPWKNSRDHIHTVEIREGVTDIAPRAFEDCDVYSVSIPNGVTTIGKQAFMNTQLYFINIPYGVTEIGDSAFYGCGMEFINMPVSVVDIDSHAFDNCLGLSDVFYPDASSADDIQCSIQDGNESFNAAEKHYGMAYLEDIGVAVPTRYRAASNYATTPQRIGIWIDGRPVYRQVCQGVFEEADIEDISQYGGKDGGGIGFCHGFAKSNEASIVLNLNTVYHRYADSPNVIDDIYPVRTGLYSIDVIVPTMTSAELAAKLTAGVSGYTTIIEYVGKEFVIKD